MSLIALQVDYSFYLKKALVFILIILTFGCNSKFKDTNTTIDRTKIIAEANKLIDTAYTLSEDGKNDESYRYFKIADSLISITNDTTLQIKILLKKNELLRNEAKYEDCIKSNYEASVLANLVNDDFSVATAYFNLSKTYYRIKKNEEARDYLTKAQDIFEKLNIEEGLNKCYTLYAVLCKGQDERTYAKELLEKAITYYSKEKNEIALSICYNNYGYIYIYEGNKGKAIEYFKKALAVSERIGNKLKIAIHTGNIGEVLLKDRQFKEAKKYISRSIALSKQMDFKETMFFNMQREIELYQKQNDYKTALLKSKELLAFKTELLGLESSELINSTEETYKKELDYLKAQNKIITLEKDKTISQKKIENNRIIFISLILILVLVSYIFWIVYAKQKKIRAKDKALFNKKQEMLLTKSKLDEVKKEQLSKELQYKQKELLNFSMNLTQREEYLNILKSIFKKIRPNQIPEKDTLTKLQNLLRDINKDGMNQIRDQIEEINSSFYYKLETSYDTLTKDDIRLASLLFLGLSSKEISNILTIEVKSVNMKCYRLKKKLNLDKEQDLKEFLTNI